MTWVDNALNAHATVLALRSERSEIISGNIANADTPNYKARDIDFKREFQNRLSGLSAMQSTSEGHINVTPKNALGELLYRVPQHENEDGNTVEAETEQSLFTKNAAQYQVSLQFLSSKIRGLKLALKGE